MPVLGLPMLSVCDRESSSLKEIRRENWSWPLISKLTSTTIVLAVMIAVPYFMICFKVFAVVLSAFAAMRRPGSFSTPNDRAVWKMPKSQWADHGEDSLAAAENECKHCGVPCASIYSKDIRRGK